MPDSRRTDEELQALLELEGKATKKRWIFNKSTGRETVWLDIVTDEEDGQELMSGETQAPEHIVHSSCREMVRGEIEQISNNLEFVAASRNSLRDIILDLQASRDRERELVEALKGVRNVVVERECDNIGGDLENGSHQVLCFVCGTVDVIDAALARAEAKEKQP